MGNYGRQIIFSRRIKRKGNTSGKEQGNDARGLRISIYGTRHPLSQNRGSRGIRRAGRARQARETDEQTDRRAGSTLYPSHTGMRQANRTHTPAIRHFYFLDPLHLFPSRREKKRKDGGKTRSRKARSKAHQGVRFFFFFV